MPKYYCSFTEVRLHSVVVEAPNAEAARKFTALVDVDKCQWDTTDYENFQVLQEEDAERSGWDTQDNPDFRCDEQGREIKHA